MAVDLAADRCPELAAADRAEWRRRVPAPSGDGPLTEAQWKAKTDELRLAIERKNRAGSRIVGEYDACRGVSAAPVVASR